DDFQSKLLSATTKHLDMLISPDGKVDSIKGKSADGMTAISFYLMYEMTGNEKYRSVAVELADQILKNMKATKHGVLYIKEKEKEADETIAGGGPPAFGWYTAYTAYIYHKEGGRDEDLKYIASVLDNYPWNESGWWAATIDIDTGEPKEALTKPSPVNKSAAIAMSAGMVSEYVKNIDPALSASLKEKADKCIYEQIIPVQETDGFWHYGLNGNDPNDKDILGYFMVTAQALIQLQQFTDSYRDPVYQSMLDKAYDFAIHHIAPMTDPNEGSYSSRTTPATPTHYSFGDDLKRGFQLVPILIGGRSIDEGEKIFDYWMKGFPYGDAGQDGAQTVHSSVLMLSLLKSAFKIPAPSALPTSSKVLVDGKAISFEAYNINGSNYFKLRDLAMAVNGTEKQFEVGWDGTKHTINITINKAYTITGAELTVSSNPTAKEAKPTTSKVYVNGIEVSFTGYNISGNNYFKLRDIGKTIDFEVMWDGNTNTIGIDTSMVMR
ncbi:MAG: hypothetical protein H7X94_00995, partial [Vallitaleaceae bacterium]|nr:hypothetical protein [Vallitaleaceae bacterium]